jgi:hypothetical protein
MTSVLDIQSKMRVAHKPLSKHTTNTARYRTAFEAIGSGEMSLRGASKFYEIKRKQLTFHYKAFVDSGISINDYKFQKNKSGRKVTLSPNGIAALKIAAHSLDSIGRPVSTSSMNLIIRSIAMKEGSNKRPCRSTLRRVRRILGMGKKTVRNGPACRKAKSQAHYIEDYFKKLALLIAKFNIKKEFM